MSAAVFRAVWPIVDESLSYADLCREAKNELPQVLALAHVEVTAPGRFSIAPSEWVPGSGRTTESVLVFEAPARATRRRNYRIPPAAAS